MWRPILLLATMLPFTAWAQFGAALPIHDLNGAAALEAHDQDGDGDLDLLGVVADTSLWLWKNLGGGSFDAGIPALTSEGGFQHLAFADLNGDGATDLCWTAWDDDALYMALSEGDGFGPVTTIGVLDAVPGVLAMADLVGSGLPGPVFTVSDGAMAGLVFWPNINGQFGDPVAVPALFAGNAPEVLVAGDLDSLNGTDLLVITDAFAAVGIMNGNGNGSQWDLLPLFVNADYPFQEPHLLDVDGDGDLDLAEANSIAVQWAENRLDLQGDMAVRVLEPFTTGGAGRFAPLGCDLSAGVVFVPSNPTLPVRWGQHLASIDGFAPRIPLQGVDRGQHVRLADLNGDDRPDLIMVRPDGAFWHPNTLLPATTEVTVPAFDTLCIFGPAVELPAAQPNGGQWTGPWVQGDVFIRSSVPGEGEYPVAYSFYEPQGCPVGDRAWLPLISGPTISPPLPPVLCSGQEPIQLSAVPAGVDWSGIGPDALLDPSTYAGQPVVAVFTDATSESCVTILSPLPVWTSLPAGIQSAGPFCTNDGLQTIVPEVDLPGTSWSGDIIASSNGSAVLDPSQGGGVYTVILTRTPQAPQQCANSDTLLVTVFDEVPEVNVPSLPPFCAEGPVVVLTGASPFGGTWTGPGVSGTALDPAIAGAGTHAVTYSYTNKFGCSNEASLLLQLLSEATVLTQERVFCPQDDAIPFEAFPQGGTWSAPLTQEGLLEPWTVSPGTLPLVYTYVAPNGCMLTNAADSLHFPSATQVSIDAPPSLCLESGPLWLLGSPPGTWSGAVSGTGEAVLLDPAAMGAGSWPVTLTARTGELCPGEATVVILVESCVGVEAVNELILSTAAPNPFLDELVLEIVGHGPVGIDIIDAYGRTVHRDRVALHGRHRMPVRLGHLAAGSYLIQLHQDGERTQLRVVKQ